MRTITQRLSVLVGGVFLIFLCLSTTSAQVLDEPPVTDPSPDTEPVVETVIPEDTTGPVISDIMTASAGVTDATIIWNTDELATSEFRYGPTEALGNTVTLGTEASLVHAATIIGLEPETIYHYCIDATDLAENTTVSCGHTFVTASAPVEAGDTNSPEITSISVSSVSHTGVTIGWTTDEPTDGYVEYGTSVNYGSLSGTDGMLSTEHSVALTDLEPDTEYHYRVITYDEVGNETVSFDETFTTGITPGDEPVEDDATEANTSTSTDGTTPVVQFSFIEIAFVDTSTVTITWNTDVPADSQIAYGTSVLLGSTTPVKPELVTEHSVTLADLEPGTNYVFRVRSKPEGATAFSRSGEYDFNTLAEDVFIDSTPDEIIEEEDHENDENDDVTENNDKDSNGSRSSSSRRNVDASDVRPIELEQVLPTYHFAEQYVRGDKDIEIEHLQQLLIAEEVYPEGLVTGYFGPLTEAALLRFQEKYNLPVTGEVSPFTRTKLNTIAETQVRPIAPGHALVLEGDLEMGATGQAVMRLQKFLIREGSYPEALVTGYFGDLTKNAVQMFQSKHNIQPASGYVGPKTRHVMKTLSGL